MMKLTKRQQEIFALIQSHMNETGSPPTRAEIAKLMGFRSPNAAEDHLRALARKGAIELVPGTSRGIRITNTSNTLPVFVYPQEGNFALIEENVAKHLKVERTLFQPGIDYILQWVSHALPDFDIAENDYVAIQKTNRANLNQLVLLHQNQNLVIKRYTLEMRQVNLPIEGVVIGIMRSFNKSSL
jgi:repressor LexA